MKPIPLAVARAFGRQVLNIESAAWLWFDWTRDARGNLVKYQWKP